MSRWYIKAATAALDQQTANEHVGIFLHGKYVRVLIDEPQSILCLSISGCILDKDWIERAFQYTETIQIHFYTVLFTVQTDYLFGTKMQICVHSLTITIFVIPI